MVGEGTIMPMVINGVIQFHFNILAKKRIEMRVSATGTKVWVSNTVNSAVILLANLGLERLNLIDWSILADLKVQESGLFERCPN